MSIVQTLKDNKGMAAVLGVLLIACVAVLWMNLKGESTPAPKPVKVETVAPTPEIKKQYEQQFEQQKKARAPSGA